MYTLLYSLSTSKGIDVDNTLWCAATSAQFGTVYHWVVLFPTLGGECGTRTHTHKAYAPKAHVSPSYTNPPYKGSYSPLYYTIIFKQNQLFFSLSALSCRFNLLIRRTLPTGSLSERRLILFV